MADEDVVIRGTFEDAMHRPLKRLEEQAKDTEKALTGMGTATAAAEVATEKASHKAKKYANEIESLDRALNSAALAELRLVAAEKAAGDARTNLAARTKDRGVAEAQLNTLKLEGLANSVELAAAEKAVHDARQKESAALTKLIGAEGKLVTSRNTLLASTKAVTTETKNLDKATESLIHKFKRAVGSTDNLAKGIGGLLIAGGAASVIQGLAGGVGALGGIAVAAVAGLAPLVGVLGGLPAAVGGMLSVVAVAKIATGGIMGVAKAMMSVTTTSQQMDAAMAALGPGGFVIVGPLRQVTNQLKQIRSGIQRAALPGFAAALSSLSPFITVVGGGLTKLAGALGGVARDGAKALASGPWRRDVTLLLDRNVTLFKTMAGAGGNIANIFRHIAVAAGPMVQMLAQAFRHGTGMAASWFEASRASGKLEAFFLKSGRLLLGVVGVLRDFGIGLIHVFEAAAPLSHSMGGGLERIAKHFREWTGSKEGQDRMRKFFTDALDTGRHLADAVGKIAKSFAELGSNAGNGSLKAIIDALGVILPMLAKALNMIANIVNAVPGLGAALAYAAVPLLIAGKVGKAGALLKGGYKGAKWLGGKAGLGRGAAAAGEAAAGEAAAGGAVLADRKSTRLNSSHW